MQTRIVQVEYHAMFSWYQAHDDRKHTKTFRTSSLKEIVKEWEILRNQPATRQHRVMYLRKYIVEDWPCDNLDPNSVQES